MGQNLQVSSHHSLLQDGDTVGIQSLTQKQICNIFRNHLKNQIQILQATSFTIDSNVQVTIRMGKYIKTFSTYYKGIVFQSNVQAYISCVDLNFFTPGKERNFYIRMDRTNSEIFKKTIRGGRASHNGDLKFYIGKFQKTLF